MTLSPDLLIALVVLVPLVGSAFVLVVPPDDRLTLRAVGVFTGLLALVPGLALLASPGAALELPFFSLRFSGVAVPAALVILGVTPMALRAGAPRVARGLQPYVTAILLAESGALFVVLVDDVVIATAAAMVAAVPFFALVALFGGPERGSVTGRAAALWLLLDAAALGALVVIEDGQLSAHRGVVIVALLGPGLVRLAAGPHGLWALPVVEQSPVAAACLMGGMVAPVGAVLLCRSVDLIHAAAGGHDALLELSPYLAGVLAVGCAIGAALVVAERDLRRMVAHLLGALGAVTALVAICGGAPTEHKEAALAAAGLAAMTGFAASLCLMLVEAIERRLETRRVTELQGLLQLAPSLGVLLPVSFWCLCGLPGPGIARALWPALGRLMGQGPETGVAAVVCGASLLMAAVGASGLLARVGGTPRKGLGQLVRVSLRQGIRLLLPVAALVAASLAHGAVLAAAAAS
ncbi:MAG: proton-conducting transporter membrane subunit [Deltaproteobacteria bacterium]|nr:proton-conducting transporter membrane subunit [Deltaproteobacteria bacterium]